MDRVAREVVAKCRRDSDISLMEVSSERLETAAIGVGAWATKKHFVDSSKKI